MNCLIQKCIQAEVDCTMNWQNILIDKKESEKISIIIFPYNDVLADINAGNIQFIMTKEITHWYYEELHNRFCALDNTIHGNHLTSMDILSLYKNSLHELGDFYQCHIDIFNEINRI